MINILYVNIAYKNFDGATFSLIDLIQSVKDQVKPIVLLRDKGEVSELFERMGIECIYHDFCPNIYFTPKNLKQKIKHIIKYIPKRIRYSTLNRQCTNYVVKILRDRNIQILHTNNSVVTVGEQIAKGLGVKHIWHFRGFMDLDFGWTPLEGWSNLKNRVTKTDAVIGVTKVVLEHFLSPNSHNAYVLYDAVRSKNEICNLPKEKYFLFCSASLSKTKGVEFAIKAYSLSSLKNSGYRLRIIGRCNDIYMEKLKSIAIERGVFDYIDFMGSTDDVKGHMKRATAFLMCSKNEGMGRVTVESMFYGCLVLGRNSGGTKEIVQNGVTGYLFNNLEECASLMRRVVNSDNSIIIRQAQDYACTNFSKEDYGKKIFAIYSRVLRYEVL